MATIIETVERENKTIHVYDNGMEKDASTGRMVRPPTSALITTTEKANEFQRRRQELKQQRLMAGAAKVLERTGSWETPNDLDVVEAIGEAVMENAIDPLSKKQIDAAKFLFTEGGFSSALERGKASELPPNAISATPEALLALVQQIEQAQAAAVARSRAVDGTVADE